MKHGNKLYNYFAYGSNMDKDRMSERKINFTSRQFAILSGYKLVFNKKAKDGDFTFLWCRVSATMEAFPADVSLIAFVRWLVDSAC